MCILCVFDETLTLVCCVIFREVIKDLNQHSKVRISPLRSMSVWRSTMYVIILYKVGSL